MHISLSLWSSYIANIEKEIKKTEPFVDSYHLDVGDGHYIPTLLFFPDFLKAIRPLTAKPLVVHLMVDNPLQWIAPFAHAGANVLVFSPNATDSPMQFIEAAKSYNVRIGICLEKEAKVDEIDEYLGLIDSVVVMGTRLGEKGINSYDKESLNKIRKLSILRKSRNYSILADGAIRKETVPQIKASGADGVVPGSLIFDNKIKVICKWLRDL